jgi:hypothetical protein
MKQRIVFETTDFKGSGQMLLRNSSPPESTDHVFAVTVAYKVGYVFVEGRQKVLLISLADGMAIVFDTTEKLCLHLNNDTVGYRPMSCSEIQSVLGEQGNRFGAWAQ